MATKTKSRGAIVADWIEQYLVHSSGDYFGRPFHLHPFQRDFLDELYRVDRAGRRMVRRALLGMAKGNGKTEIAAAIGIVELAGPFAPQSPEVIVAAASFEQADLVFGSARTMIAEGPLAAYFDTYDTEILRRDGAPGVMRRVAAAAGTNDGARPTCLIPDELHEWTGQRERVHLVLSNGLSKRRDGLELNISTAGSDPDSLLGRLVDYGQRLESGEIVDPSFLYRWYAASDGHDLSDPEQLRVALREANPAIAAGFLDEDRLVARFGEIPSWEYQRYHLNRFVSAAGEAWIAPDAWEACADPGRLPPDGSRIVAGFDGSATRDNTALVIANLDSPTPHLHVYGHWSRDPQDPSWVVPRDEVDGRIEAMMRRWKVQRLDCDPAGWYSEIGEWRARYGEETVVDVPQTNERMAPAADRFRAAVMARDLTHDGHPALARAIANATMRETRWGVGIKKDHPGSPRKIDAAIAAILAHNAATSWEPPKQKAPPAFAFR